MLLVFAFATSALSQATFPSPVLTSISPLGAKHGSEVELTLRGSDLDAPQAILLSSSKGVQPHHLLPVQVVPGKTTVVRFKLPETSTAYHDIRFVGRFGVSNPRGFLVHLNEDMKSPGSNSTRENALKIKLNTVVHGTFKTAEPQWFKFETTSGQHIALTVDRRDLDTRAVLQGALQRSTGEEVARIRGTTLAWHADAGGEYFLELHELMHRAGDDYAFSLIAHAMPAPVANGGAPQPAKRQPMPISVPTAIGGQFAEEPEVYELDLKAGEKVVFQVTSHQQGNPSDPHLFIQEVKADGTLKPIAEPADAPVISPAPSLPLPNRDPSHAYEAKAPIKLRVTLNDNFKTQSRFFFSVEPADPGLLHDDLIVLNATLPSAAARKGYEVGTANACRGGILALEVVAPNRTSFSNAIELKTDPATLPPGLTCLGGYIGKGQSLGYLAFQAAPDAAPGAGTVDAAFDAAYVQFAVGDAARDQLLIRHTRPAAIGVSALTTPALVMSEASGILEVAADGKLDIPLKVTRHADFPDALKLKVLGLVEAAKAPETDIAAKANVGKLTLDVKALKLAPGEYGLILQGPAKMKVQRNVEGLAAAEAKRKAADEAAKKAGKELEVAQLIRKSSKPGDDLEANEKALKQAMADAAKAEADKKAASALLKDIATKTPAKESTFIVYSNPIRIRVKGK